MNQNTLKNAVGKRASELVEDGMLVGLGTGTTATFFIQHLIDRCRAGLKIVAVSSSLRSLEMAKRGGIEVLPMDEVTSIDLTIDGADEIDPKNRMIKGGGGAHLREKIIATTSRAIITIVDESKCVDVLGKFGVPIEVVPFGLKSTIAKIETLGYTGKIRTSEAKERYLTDNGNCIFDIHFPAAFTHPEEDHNRIITLPGVVETGFFFNLPIRVLVGYENGNVGFRNG